jgi:2-polyprenyl-6-methoxyphenol hydroxylase-like FAD-dependent oxidoreductase
MATKIGDHAIVLGGSMAGLLTARVLADRFERVTLVERDQFPDIGESRKGVPQGRHAHGLLYRGREILDELFPGFSEEVVAAGGRTGDITAEGLWINDGIRQADYVSGMRGLAASRPFLEGHVRARVRALPGVEFIEACDSVGITSTADHSRVTGARILRKEDGSAEETLAADLVVDATGRGSRSVAWLQELGYAAPEEERVRVGVGYSTCILRRQAGDLDGKMFAIVGASPPNRRVGVVLPMENDRWMVTLAGYLGEFPPTDLPGYVDFSATLPSPEIHGLLRSAEALTDPLPYRFPASQRRRFERLKRFPTGFLVIGDAIASFNPIYGQGMTVAASEALLLGECLDGRPERLWRTFFKKAGRFVDSPWQIATGADLAFDEVEGPRNAQIRLVNWYMKRLHPAASRDPKVALAFQRVINLVDPPPTIMAPRTAWRVLRPGLGRAAPRVQEAPSRVET